MRRKKKLKKQGESVSQKLKEIENLQEEKARLQHWDVRLIGHLNLSSQVPKPSFSMFSRGTRLGCLVVYNIINTTLNFVISNA